MKIVKDLYLGKNTYFIDNLIINGCQCFKIEDLEFICWLFTISDSTKKKILEAYYENQNNISHNGEDWEFVVKHAGLNACKHLTKHHNLELHKVLMKSEEFLIIHLLVITTPYVEVLDYLIENTPRSLSKDVIIGRKQILLKNQKTE